MNKFDATSRESIITHARKLLGKSINELYDNPLPISTGKGGLGQSVEKYHFGYAPNSEAQPDFPEADIELKCTPLKILKDGNVVSKERLVLNIIDYMKEAKTSFYDSSFWHKNAFLLLMFYLHEDQKPYLDFIFKIIRYWAFPDEDLKIIKDDWTKIQRKILAGKAHELSEGDTLFLGACSKGSRALENLREQPGEKSPKAQQRAFSIKSVYLNTIIQDSLLDKEMYSDIQMNTKYINQLQTRIKKLKEEASRAVQSPEEYLEGETFEELIVRKFKPYYGMDVFQLEKLFNTTINTHSKDFAYKIARLILGVQTKRITEFEKAGLLLKTIQLESSGKLKESMSFPNVQYCSIVAEEEWEASFWNSVLTRRFLFVVFQKDYSKDKQKVKLKNVFFWGMSVEDLEKSRMFWEDTRNKICNNDYLHFLKSSEHPICHIRPKGINAEDLMLTPQGHYEKKKCYWLNRAYITKIINQECTTNE